MISKHAITTSFPLGLFCTATLSGPLPRAKMPAMPTTFQKADRKIEYLTPLKLKIEGLKDDLTWED